MKRSVSIIALLTLALVPSLASAQGSTRTITVGASGGLSLPVGDFGDRAKAGYSVAGHVYLAPTSMPRLTLRGDVSYDAWDASSRLVLTDKSASMLGLTANGLLNLGERTSAMRPYLLGGVGAFRSQRNLLANNGATVSTSDTNAGVQAGVGFDFNLSGFSTFLETKLVNVFTDGNSSMYVPITFGVRF